jgi:hypothetical protein
MQWLSIIIFYIKTDQFFGISNLHEVFMKESLLYYSYSFEVGVLEIVGVFLI